MTLKTLTTWSASILAVAVLAACAQDNAADDTAMVPPPDATATDPATDPMTTPGAPDAMAMAPDAAGGQPAEALALVIAVDEHDIAAAEQARSKEVDGEVLEYANMLHTEHTANLQATRQLMQGGATASAPADTPEVQAQREKGQAALRDLAAMDGDAYERAYLDAMVQGHTDALAMLDQHLQSTTLDDQVRQHLTTTRGHIATHLERGQELQGSMQQ